MIFRTILRFWPNFCHKKSWPGQLEYSKVCFSSKAHFSKRTDSFCAANLNLIPQKIYPRYAVKCLTFLKKELKIVIFDRTDKKRQQVRPFVKHYYNQVSKISISYISINLLYIKEQIQDKCSGCSMSVSQLFVAKCYKIQQNLVLVERKIVENLAIVEHF